MIVPVVLCGGAGTRLWPLSRSEHPKQLIALTGERTLLEATIDRLAPVTAGAAPILVCGEVHRFQVAEQARRAGAAEALIVLEPEGRGTAPAVTIAALAAREQAGGTDPILVVAPADHHVADPAAFQAAVYRALVRARKGELVLFGVEPTGPETGFGYIVPDEEERVRAFIEKPVREHAAALIAEGALWNSGIFVFSAARWLAELARFAPDILAACTEAFEGAVRERDFLRLPASFRPRADSIDRAVMERTGDASVVPLAVGWNDVGSWSAVADCLPVDARGNATKGDVVLEDARGCCVIAESRLVAAVGLTDHVIVETPDAVLVVPRNRAQNVRELVDQLKARGGSVVSEHRMVSRPWGRYDVVDQGPHHKVKRLTVEPGGRLSLQEHARRSEHWVVVAGRARVTRGDEVIELAPDQSIHIPIGTRHRIENPGDERLELIEVQSGDYLGEDDIVRHEDTYGRVAQRTVSR